MEQVLAVLLGQMRKERQWAGTVRGAQGAGGLLIPALLTRRKGTPAVSQPITPCSFELPGSC